MDVMPFTVDLMSYIVDEMSLIQSVRSYIWWVRYSHRYNGCEVYIGSDVIRVTVMSYMLGVVS